MRALGLYNRGFQSSPGTLTGCNQVYALDTSPTTKFQSSPGTLTGCNVPRIGAVDVVSGFQSSPGTLTGCNHGGNR